MYTSTTTLLAAFDGEVSVDNHLHELRYLEDSRLLLEKKGDFKNLLADAGQAVLSSGAIAATGGAGGDVVVDVIFAAKTASRVLEEVNSIIASAGELGKIILDAARLDFDGSEAFEEKVKSLIRRTVKNQIVGDKAKEMIEKASEKINEILEKIARAVGKWVAFLIPDDFGMGGPAFEAIFQSVLKTAGENVYSIAIAGMKALPFNAGNYLIDRDALEDLLETIATKMIEFIDNVTEWAESERASIEDESLGDMLSRKSRASIASTKASAKIAAAWVKSGFSKSIAMSPTVAAYSFANNLSDGRLELATEKAQQNFVDYLRDNDVDEEIVSATERYYSKVGSPLKIRASLDMMDDKNRENFKSALGEYVAAAKQANKGEIIYMSEKALPAARDYLVKFRNDWIPTTVAVIRKLMSYLMAGLVLFQELVDPQEYLDLKTKKSPYGSIGDATMGDTFDNIKLTASDANIKEVVHRAIMTESRNRIKRIAREEVNRHQLRSIIREEMTLDEKKRPKPKVTLWDAIRDKRERGEKPAAPGEEGYPDERTWRSATNEADLDEKKGLWANIHAKKKRGGKSNPRSKSYKAAKKAGEKINKDAKRKK